MIRNRIAGHNSGCSATMLLDKSLRKVELTGLAPLWSYKVRPYSSEKTKWCQSAFCAHEPIVHKAVNCLSLGGSFIKTPLHAINGAANLGELRKPKLVYL